MPTYLHALQTWTPDSLYLQEEASTAMQAQVGDPRVRRIIRHIHRQSAIDQRHVVWQNDADALFPVDGDGRWHNPGTGARNQAYTRYAAPAAAELARRCLAAAPHLAAADVTHVITASCTGFSNPGIDIQICRALQLPDTTARFHLGFMGCSAAFPALRMAKALCDADPQAVVLVLCLELCSLHFQPGNTSEDALIAGALFADGAGAALVSQRPPPPGLPAVRLQGFSTTLTPTGGESMAWNIGDEGFEMVLGTYVPHIIDDHIVGALEPLLSRDDSLSGHPYRDIRHWAIHPGGRSILDKVQARLELSDEQLVPARETLRNFGNMSSATVLFVIRHILDLPVEADAGDNLAAEASGGDGGERICSMAFGPGLTVETALFTKITAPQSARGEAEPEHAGLPRPASALA